MSIKQDLMNGELWMAQQRRKIGAKKFDEWMRSQEIRKYTNFEDETELKKYIKKAGYDWSETYTMLYRYVKTHITKEYPIYWIYEQNKLVASVSADIDKKVLGNFTNAIAHVAGRPCFFDSISETKTPVYNFPTIYTDKAVLKQTLKNLKISAIEERGKLSFEIPNCLIELKSSKNGAYEFKATGYADLKEIHRYFAKIESEYERVVQSNICKNIKSKIAQNPSMKLEQEEVLEDNSVLLTIRV